MVSHINVPVSRSQDGQSVLIVGAGPTGLTLAAVLLRQGIVPRLIDRAVAPPDDRSRAIVIQARTMEVFDDLGIVEEVQRAGMVVGAANVFTTSGRRGALRIRPQWIDSAYGNLLTLPQEDTERILTALVERQGGLVERGVELAGLAQRETGVDATLHHANGRVEHAMVDWVVGGDGAHSAVRHALGVPFPGVTYPDECLLGDVDLEWALPDSEVSICPNQHGVLLAFPLPGDHRFRIIMIRPVQLVGDDRTLTRADFAAQLERMTPVGHGAHGSNTPRIVTSRWLSRYRLHRRGVTAYRRGRCFLGGDAAHIHSPAGAQGMNTGIQDSYNLGWKLALVATGQAPDSLLDTYHVERHRIGQILLTSTDRMFAVLAGGGWFGRLARRVVPMLAVRLLVTPIFGRRLAQFVSQTRIHYRASPLSREGTGTRTWERGAPVPGDRAPDVVLSRDVRLHALLHGGHHTLLLFAGVPPTNNAVLATLRADVMAAYGSLVQLVTLTPEHAENSDGVLDPHGAAHHRYGANGGALYLVRPDGHIAFRGRQDVGAQLLADLATRFCVM